MRWSVHSVRWAFSLANSARCCRVTMKESLPWKQNSLFDLNLFTCEAMELEKVCRTCSDLDVSWIRETQEKMLPLKWADPILIRKVKMKELNGQGNVPSYKRELCLLWSRFGQLCLSGRAIAVATNLKTLPFPFQSIKDWTAETWQIFGSLPSTKCCVKVLKARLTSALTASCSVKNHSVN